MKNSLPETRPGIADSGLPRIVVIGSGFGGPELVKGLASAPVRTVLTDRQNHHTFQPFLYQVATCALETSYIVCPFRKRYHHAPRVFFRLGEVINIFPEEQCTETSIGRIRYDYLVIATGAITNYYNPRDVEHYAIGMKSTVDAIKLCNTIMRSYEQALLTDDVRLRNCLMDFVIGGGGPTGVELAGALAELKRHVFPEDELRPEEMDIFLPEGGPRLLSAMSEEASQKALAYLTEMGVHVQLNTAVQSYGGEEVVLSDGRKINPKMLIWAAGVKANPLPGLSVESLTPAGRHCVHAFCRVQEYNNIFATGDVAFMEVDPGWKCGHPMVASPAMHQGRWLASDFRRWFKGLPMKPFRYRDKETMTTVCCNKAVVDLKNMKLQIFFTWYVWMFVHLLYLVGFRIKLFVFLSWAGSYFSYDKSNRLIIGRPQ